MHNKNITSTKLNGRLVQILFKGRISEETPYMWTNYWKVSAYNTRQDKRMQKKMERLSIS